MLSEDSYITAWLIYGFATVGALLVLNHWLRAAIGFTARCVLLLLLAGLALAPALPDASGETWAPAIFVAAFTLLTDGMEAAAPAFRSLAAGAAMGVVVALVVLAARKVLQPVLGKGEAA